VLVADQHVPQGSNHASKGGSQTDWETLGGVAF
jgi:hypothetical protein